MIKEDATPALGALPDARRLTPVAPAMDSEMILTKISVCADLLFVGLGERNWDRTSEPSLFRRNWTIAGCPSL